MLLPYVVVSALETVRWPDHREARLVSQVPEALASCEAWDHLAPPLEGDRWVVLRSERVNGLGDWLAGFLSAFIVAAATRSRFYVESPFDTMISFAPYDVAPSTRRRLKVVGCLNSTIAAIRQASGIIEYPGAKNRGCAWTWGGALGEPFWSAFGKGARASDYETRAALVYGCVLKRFFRPGPSVLELMPELPDGTVVSVHMRFGDESMTTRECNGTFPGNLRFVGDELAWISAFHGTERATYRIESDDVCIRDLLASEMRRRGHSVLPTVRPSHNSVDAAQLAAWFDFQRADAFAFKTFCRASIGRFGYHYGARLSSWSVMALLAAGHTQFRCLCPIPHSHGCPINQVSGARCDVRNFTGISLGMGRPMHHDDAVSKSPGQYWSVGNLWR